MLEAISCLTDIHFGRGALAVLPELLGRLGIAREWRAGMKISN